MLYAGHVWSWRNAAAYWAAGPARDRPRRSGSRARVDVDHRAYGAQSSSLRVSAPVDLLRDRKAASPRARQPDHLFEPGGARRLQMQPGVVLADAPARSAVDRELVAARVDAELQIRGQAELRIAKAITARSSSNSCSNWSTSPT